MNCFNSIVSANKGLPRIGRYRNKQLANYILFFIRSDDKINPRKPFLLYPQILEDLAHARTLFGQAASPFFLVNYVFKRLPFSSSDYSFYEFAAESLFVCGIA
jgi:hypothetical protein